MSELRTRDLTIHDIAHAAGVSTATVSRVINGSAGVKSDKAERVQSVIERLGYKPNPFARSLLGQGSKAIGVLVPQLEDEFYGKIVTGLERRLRTEGLHVMVSLGHNDPNDERDALETFRARQVDGLILLANRLPDAALLELNETHVPVVLVNRFLPELAPHCVRLDNVRGGYKATEHLISLGHTRIAHITGSLERPGSRERLEGYRAALRDAGLERDDALVVEGDFSEDGGLVATERVLKRTNFSAIFAASDRLALGALVALREAGLEVPREVSLIGYDDRSVARFTSPPLSTMHYPMLEMGAQAADHLIALLRGETPPPLPLLEPALVVRSSSGAFVKKRKR